MTNDDNLRDRVKPSVPDVGVTDDDGRVSDFLLSASSFSQCLPAPSIKRRWLSGQERRLRTGRSVFDPECRRI
ncbi:hypothetical protein EVAR_3748_1 [Eumeta japonica]|uniref:Uncharacterized protein n=1 Tax=Eumeta variegata TaxID=151549 RepID=A0A4C1SRI8_EUMVA|nr:hypothetical protein EVAR_3748_1 [Eumeta japonica]